MKRIQFPVLFLLAAILSDLHSASGQASNASMQTVAPHTVTTRSAPAAKPIARPGIAPQFAPRSANMNGRILNSSPPRAIAQSPTNLQRIYSPPVRTSNPALASLGAQDSAVGQQAINIDPATRQNELRTLEAMRERRGYIKGQPTALDAETRKTELRTLKAMRERQESEISNQTLATLSARRRVSNRDPAAGPSSEPRNPKDAAAGKKHTKKDHLGFKDAFRLHWHEWHDRTWWQSNCETIVFVNTGYYFLEGSYWYPAWGYDPMQTYYDYDGPIYTYSDLLPDEVIANVQTALQDAGYYYGPITGSLSADTRAAIANFQRDNGLEITGAIDEPTVEALGLY